MKVLQFAYAISFGDVEGLSLVIFLYIVVSRCAEDITDDTQSKKGLVLGEGDRIEMGHGTQDASNQGHQDLQIGVLVVLLEALVTGLN